MFAATHLDFYRGEQAKFDVSPVGISGGFLATDTVQFIAKRKLNTSDAAAEIDVNGAFVTSSIFRITIPDSKTLPFPVTEIVELFYSCVWTRPGEELVLKAGTVWVHPHARSS